MKNLSVLRKEKTAELIKLQLTKHKQLESRQTSVELKPFFTSIKIDTRQWTFVNLIDELRLIGHLPSRLQQRFQHLMYQVHIGSIFTKDTVNISQD